MIEPDRSLPRLQSRPHAKPVPLWVALACAIAGPLVDQYLKRRDARLLSRSGELMEKVRGCVTRAEVLAILGKPRYCLSGDLYQVENKKPDSVECYVKDGCTIELLFRQGQLWQLTGAPDLSVWKVARLTSRVAIDP